MKKAASSTNSGQVPLKTLFANMASKEKNSDSDVSFDARDSEAGGTKKGGQATNKRLSVERIYQKKSQLEHILLRPDTYVGSVETVTQTMWVYDGEETGMVQREITFVPGLYKIFDEVLVNAADNKQRDKNMDCIKIEIDPENNKISIWNNGKGIPVVEHKVEKMFVPSLIFGHLLTSSNYNDEEKKVTGGRNGYGAKLCNIFSKKFTVETATRENKKCFKQTWADNMTKTTDPKVSGHSGDDYTVITFYPDLEKFKMDVLDKDIVSLMSRRAYDVAGSTKGVKVYLNGKRLPVKHFKDYIEQYIKGKEDEQGNPLKVVHENAGERWEVAVTLSEKGFQQVSFVNSIATTKGGRHVDYVADQVITKVIEAVKRKNKGGIQVKPFQIKNHLWLFVNCLIENPTFDSQTKENMTLQPKNFGSKCALSEKFNSQVLKCGIVESIMSWVKFKAQTQLNKKCSATKHSKLRGVPKLEDANDAGTKNSIDCTLILTEGDSAKTLAVSGLGVVGRDKYGVFPLRGKMLNVREASVKQILENAEINNVIKIMGLQYKKKYESVDDLKTLRYGRLMIMTDQDQDGSHIKGLLINFIHHNWPSLLRLPFLEEFITPIVKATKGKEERCFYSLPEFEEWKTETNNWNAWKVKYYKGLGTSTAKEAKEYFMDMIRHRIKFKYQGPEDDHAIQLAFSKKMIDHRKEWLTNGMEERKRRRELGLPELYLYGKQTSAITYNDFVNKELILFSNTDNERSIPSLVDGLKPGQRKVMYTCFKRNDKREVKVAQLAGSVAEQSAYHHGEAALTGTIINLAQNFVGSNNINLLKPDGQFGTRLQGGKDAASPRYIFTMLSTMARHIMPNVDDNLLRNLYDDNQKIEPEYYVPTVPMVLINGAEGIGTGWSTKIPNYNPREVVENIKRMLNGDEPLQMKPWFKNFRGVIEQLDNQRFVVSGEVAILGPTKLEITELPVRTWTQSYKEQVLEVMLHGSDKTPPLITDYKEYHTDTTVRFVVTMNEDKLARAEEQGLHKIFKLQSVFSTSSMVLFDSNGCLKRYESPDEILREFYNVRLDFYKRRKAYLEGMLAAEASKLSNQARFILEKIEGKIVIENKKKLDMIRTLQERGYDSDPVKAWKEAQSKSRDLELPENTEDSDSEAENEASNSGPDYDYLLGMTLWSLTRERKEDLLKKRDEKKAELHAIQKKTPSDLWLEDLKNFLEELEKVEKKQLEDDNVGIQVKGAAKLGFGKSRPKKLAEETKPSPHAQRIVPYIDAEMRKKIEKPSANSGDGKKRGRQKKEDAKKDKDDEPLPLSERIGTSPDKLEQKKSKKMKQTTIAFKGSDKKKTSPKKKGPKKNPWSDSESEVNISDGSEMEDRLEDSEAFQAEKRLAIPRRAAASKAKYTFESDEEGGAKSEEELLFENSNVVEEGQRNRQRISSGSEVDEVEEVKPKKRPQAPKKKPEPEPESDNESDAKVNGATTPIGDDSDSDESIKPNGKAAAGESDTNALFDSLLGCGSEEKKNLDPFPTKAASKAPPEEVDLDSDSSFDMVVEKETKETKTTAPAPKKRQRKMNSSSSEASDGDFLPKPKKSAPPAKKPAVAGRRKKSKNTSSSDDDDVREMPPAKPKKHVQKKKKVVEEDFSDGGTQAGGDFDYPRSRTARSRAPVKYDFGSSDED